LVFSFPFLFLTFFDSAAFGSTEETIDRTVGVGSSLLFFVCQGQGVPSVFLFVSFDCGKLIAETRESPALWFLLALILPF